MIACGWIRLALTDVLLRGISRDAKQSMTASFGGAEACGVYDSYVLCVNKVVCYLCEINLWPRGTNRTGNAVRGGELVSRFNGVDRLLYLV